MILELTDFLKRPYLIPNQQESVDLEEWIDATERNLLKDLLGYELYKEFNEALESSQPLDQRFVDLRDGVEYTYNDVLRKYEGMLDLLRPAVYALWIEEGAYKFTNVGWVVNNAQEQSQTLEDTEQFVVKYWNEYAKKAKALYDYFTVTSDDYPELIFTHVKTKNRLGL